MKDHEKLLIGTACTWVIAPRVVSSSGSCGGTVTKRSPPGSVPDAIPHHHVLLPVLEHNQNFKGLG